MPEIKASPRNRLLGVFADAAKNVNDFASRPFGYDNPPVQALMGLLGVPAVANTLNELSYGGALGTGSGMTWKPKADTVDAAMTLLPLGATAGKAALDGGVSLAKKAAPAIERAVPRIMEKGGVGAGLLQDLTQGSRSQIFAGQGAKTADKGLLKVAQERIAAGDAPADVWRETGWGRGPDGKWRFEIDDDASRYLENKTATEFMSSPGPAEYPVGSVSNILEHQQLNAAYPDAMSIKTRLKKGQQGAYIPDTGFGEGFDLPSSGTHSTALHELQHAVQKREGFSLGGSPETMAGGANNSSRINEINDILNSGKYSMSDYQKLLAEKRDLIQASDISPMEAYQRLGGEAEARLTQARMNLTPEQRAAQYPWEPDYFRAQTGVGLDELIHRGGNGPAMSVKPGLLGPTVTRDAYVGGHKAPMKGSGAPLHDLTQVYPDDIYSPKAIQYYGTGEPALDRGTFRKVGAYKGNPDAPVTMYRAVPDTVPADAVINNGDWVTINPEYAKMHGEGPLGGKYRVLQQQVPARKLFTNGDSIHEFGYDESGRIRPGLLGLIGAGTGLGLLGNQWLTDR